MFQSPCRVVDLGCYLDQASWPPWGYKATHVTHTQGAKAMARFFNVRGFESSDGEMQRDDFPEAMGLAWTSVHMSDHTGNHIDAPYHFGPKVEGRPAKTIDEVPLDWCAGPGVRIDCRSHRGRDVGVDHLRGELDRIRVTLGPGMIPLLWTGADAFIDDPDQYWQQQAGLSPEGLSYLLDQGVRLVAIDAYAMDVSYDTMHALKEDGSPNVFPLHFVGRAREHLHLEKLMNLGSLPQPTGFWFVAMPIKVRDGSAGWVRPVAFVPEEHYAQENITW